MTTPPVQGRHRTDRGAAVLLLIVASAVAWEARTFQVAFVTDPVGPRALPLLIAGVLAVCALSLLVKPGPEPNWPRRSGLVRATGGVAVFGLYGALLEPIGFGVSTVLAVTLLGLLFEGRLLPSLVSGIAFSAALWLLFVFALGIPLPLGVFDGGRL